MFDINFKYYINLKKIIIYGDLSTLENIAKIINSLYFKEKWGTEGSQS